MAIDLCGQRFGKLIVICKEGSYISPSGYTEPKWRCVCDCGKTAIIRGSSLRSGQCKSCGCLKLERIRKAQTKHGYADKERLYRIWDLMRCRCYNENNERYPLYGGRGIVICDEWNNYNVFRDWAISSGYNDSLSIDRIDVNKGYSPENCRWATQKQQCNNKRTNHYITYKNITKSMSVWADEIGINYNTLRSRIRNGWEPEKAFFTPVNRRHTNE